MENQIKEIINYCLDDKDEIIDRENRHLYLNDTVDESIIDSLVYMILRFNREDKGKEIKDRKPIILYINSPGGNVSDGYGLIDAILTSKTHVYTVNQAMCASMGFLIYIAGQKRYCMPHAEFLMHDGSSFGWDSTAKLKDRIDFETGQLEQMTKNYIISHTKIDEATYDIKYRVEWYFLPKEAKEIGVIDYIVGEDCDIDEII